MTWTHARTNMQSHTQTHTHAHTHTDTQTHAHTRTHTYTHTYVNSCRCAVLMSCAAPLTAHVRPASGRVPAIVTAHTLVHLGATRGPALLVMFHPADLVTVASPCERCLATLCGCRCVCVQVQVTVHMCCGWQETRTKTYTSKSPSRLTR